MKSFEKMFGVGALAAGLLVVPTSRLKAADGFALEAYASDHDFPEDRELRGLVDRTQSDLRFASDLGHGDKQRNRYHKAQDHLSKLDRSLVHGKYNKGALNDSIDELKSILDHNTLQASARDALARDLMDLKVARARH